MFKDSTRREESKIRAIDWSSFQSLFSSCIHYIQCGILVVLCLLRSPRRSQQLYGWTHLDARFWTSSMLSTYELHYWHCVFSRLDSVYVDSMLRWCKFSAGQWCYDKCMTHSNIFLYITAPKKTWAWHTQYPTVNVLKGSNHAIKQQSMRIALNGEREKRKIGSARFVHVFEFAVTQFEWGNNSPRNGH